MIYCFFRGVGLGQLNVYTEQPWSLFGLGTRRSCSVPAAVLGHLQHLFHRCFCPFPGARSSDPLALLLFLPSGLAPLLPQYDPISSSIFFASWALDGKAQRFPKRLPGFQVAKAPQFLPRLFKAGRNKSRENPGLPSCPVLGPTGLLCSGAPKIQPA